MSDAVCTGLQLVNFVQDPPRDRHWAGLPAPGGPPALRRRRRRPRGAADAVRRRAPPLRGGRARSLLEGAAAAAGAWRRPGSRRPLRPRRPGRSRRSGTGQLGRLHRTASADAPGLRGPCAARARSAMRAEDAYAEVVRITRREARNFAWGIAAPSRSGSPSPRSTRLRVASTTSPTIRLGRRGAAPRLEACRSAVEAMPGAGRSRARRPGGRDARYPVPRSALLDLVSGGLMDAETSRYASWEELREYCRCVAGAVGLACTAVYGPRDPAAAAPRAETLGLRAAADQHHAGRRRGLGARPRLPPARRARALRRHRGRHRGGPGEPGLAGADGSPGLPGGVAHAGGPRAPAAPRPSQRPVRPRVRRDLPRPPRPDARRGYDVFSQRPQLSAVGKLRAVAAL